MTESLISVIDRLAQFADYYLDHDEAPEANDPQLLHAYIRGCLSIPAEQMLPKSMIACFATIFLNNEALLYRGGSYAPENLLAIFRSAERHYPNDFADLVYRAVNARLHHRAVNEWVDHEDLRLEDMNWYQVAIALESMARRAGWDGRYHDEAEWVSFKRSSVLFTMLHNIGVMGVLDGRSNRSQIDLACIAAARGLESFANANPTFPMQIEMRALAGLPSKDYFEKNSEYMQMCRVEDNMTEIMYALKVELAKNGKMSSNPADACVLAAWADGFRCSAMTFRFLENALLDEKAGVKPSNELLFAVIGVRIGFEAWHNKAFGGALPPGHTNQSANMRFPMS